MKHSHQLKATAAAILSVFAASASVAQGYSYTEPAGGSYNPSGYVLPSINANSPDDRFGISKNGTGGGLRFGTPVSPSWDMQLGVQYGRVKDGGNKFEQVTLGLDGVYLFSRSRFRPLVLVGIGAERDQFTSATSKARSTSPFVGVGAGFQLSFTDQWGMQMDVRRNQAFLRGDNFGGKRANTDIVNLGVMYTFDKAPQSAPRMAQAPVIVEAPARVAPPAPAPAPVIIVNPPAPAPAPVAAPPPPPPRLERITLSASKLFDFDSAELRTPMPKLDEVADVLAKNPDATSIVINGYTDRLGSEAYNQALSQKRADAVKGYMVNRGVSANRMRATGRGESNPVATCTDRNIAKLRECLEPNRRVEIEQITIERRVQ